MKQITSIATNAKSVYSNFNKFEVRCDKRKRRRPGKNTNILSLLWDWLANINLDAFSQLPIFSEYSFPFNMPFYCQPLISAPQVSDPFKTCDTSNIFKHQANLWYLQWPTHINPLNSCDILNIPINKLNQRSLLLIARFVRYKYSVSYDDICKWNKLQISNGDHTKQTWFDSWVNSNIWH